MRIGVLLLAVLAFAAPAAGGVSAYPSSQAIPASGPIPGGIATARLNTAIGEREGLWVVASGATQVSATVDRSDLGTIQAGLYWGHYVNFSGRLIPDALLEWNGSGRMAEQPNQPIYLQINVPYGTQPGVYQGSVDVSTDGDATVVPFSVNVYPVVLPKPSDSNGNFLTSFHLLAGTYVAKAGALHGFGDGQRIEANARLYSFLAAYRVSPSSWGFGQPTSRAGYETSAQWWLDAAGNMKLEVGSGQFPAMRIPISSNRASLRHRIAGVAYDQPETWCDYLGAVRRFWEANGWLGNTVQYVYALDEPSPRRQGLAARQSEVLHQCWPGGKLLVTTHPSAANAFLFDNEGVDDLDIFAVLSRRFYGRFTTPAKQKLGEFRSRTNLRWIQLVRQRGKDVWSYTYSGVAGTPGYAASEPLSNPRMFLLWNALENTDGTLYSQGTTNYTSGDPLQSVEQEGEFVLLYPSATGPPIASARLEQIRDGIEDVLIFDVVRSKRGASRVWSILGQAGLFSASAEGVKLACHMGCELKSSTKFSWPLWSHSSGTPARIERAKFQALETASE